MAPPDNRNVAPGDQPVRVDNIKEQSWISAEGQPGLIGQIFFATNDATVDADTQAKLDAMAAKYAHDMVLNPTTKYSFYFMGYADHRATPLDNYKLSRSRAEAVEVIVRRTLFTTENLTMHTQGLGVDEGDLNSTDSKTLAIHRRVDIIGPKLLGVPPPPPPPPPPEKPKPKLGHTWKARMKASGSAGIAWVQGDHFYMDIVDVDNQLKDEFVYKGFGMGLSATPVGLSYSKDPSDWYNFTTEDAVELADFEGFAFHTAIQAQVSFQPGFTGDLVILTLAHATRPHSWQRMTFKSFTILDPNAGLGAAQTGGTLEPTWKTGPLKGPVPWSPSDP